MDVRQVRADLLAEQRALDDVVAPLTPDQWARQTPSPRWTVADQIGHLTFFDRAATIAISDPETFKEMVTELWEVAAQGDEAGDTFTLADYRKLTPDELLATWRRERDGLADASITLQDDTRVIWYGPSMGSKSFLTARLMEVWAHGQDIVDSVGAQRPATDRLAHIAKLGFITRGWSYVNRGLEAPDVEVRVELAAPSGATWVFGPETAEESVVGDAEDFCLVVTQRRHLEDTGLAVTGDAARDWMEKAQAFAGPPTDGPDAAAR